MQKMLTLL